PGQMPPEHLTADLRRLLEERLPDYMVPSAYVLLPELPLSPNGKVDRKALPLPETDRGRAGHKATSPRDADEEALERIWAAVLGLEKVGIHDDFFCLGGHSLLATLVMSQVRDRFGAELPLRTLFESPTIAGLAKRVAAARESAAGTAAILEPPLMPVLRASA